MKSEFEIAITQLCSDRNVSPEVIIEAIEAALVSAYRRNYGTDENISVSVDRHTGKATVYVVKDVVEAVEDERVQISLQDARMRDTSSRIGDTVQIELRPRNFGRIAAQTAKQVIMQRIREAERDSVYSEYVDRVGEIANGVVRNVDGKSGTVTVSLGKAEAVMPRSEQMQREFYKFGQRVRVYIAEADHSTHGPQIIVSRSHPGLLRRLLELEVPEIYNGTVEIKAIAREAGSRSKVAVYSAQKGVDPVGSCVGMRGVRIQSIVSELNGEKIDIVPWSDDQSVFIANALSPAQVTAVYLAADEKTAKVVVPENALSLAIGKEGQNARLAFKLTGWRIDIRSEEMDAEEAAELEEVAREAKLRTDARDAEVRAAAELLAQAESLLGGSANPSVASEDEGLVDEAVLDSEDSEFDEASLEDILDEPIVVDDAVVSVPPDEAAESSSSKKTRARHPRETEGDGVRVAPRPARKKRQPENPNSRWRWDEQLGEEDE